MFSVLIFFVSCVSLRKLKSSFIAVASVSSSLRSSAVSCPDGTLWCRYDLILFCVLFVKCIAFCTLARGSLFLSINVIVFWVYAWYKCCLRAYWSISLVCNHSSTHWFYVVPFSSALCVCSFIATPQNALRVSEHIELMEPCKNDDVTVVDWVRKTRARFGKEVVSSLSARGMIHLLYCLLHLCMEYINLPPCPAHLTKFNFLFAVFLSVVVTNVPYFRPKKRTFAFR